jgi:hypothetical protein
VASSGSIAVLEAFAARFPDTVYATFARARIEELKKQQQATLPPPKEVEPEGRSRFPKGALGGRMYTFSCSGSECSIGALDKVEQLPIGATGAFEADLTSRRWNIDDKQMPVSEVASEQSPAVMVICNETWPQVNADNGVIELYSGLDVGRIGASLEQKVRGFAPPSSEVANYDLWWAVCKGQMFKYSSAPK